MSLFMNFPAEQGATLMSSQAKKSDLAADKVAVILVDHGSKIDQSNRLLEDIVAAYRQHSDWTIVEPAHMELAEPSIASAFDRCAQQGANMVIVMPYFLGPGRHSSQDIPRLTAQAACAHPGIEHLVTEPLGLHELMLKVVDQRISEAIGSSKPR